MKLRHTTSETKQEQPWYHQPETVVETVAETPVASTIPSQPQTRQPAPPALFEPAAAERILARAGALQEIHGQLLSPEQIEAIAAEIGIKPEFLQLAMEQEKAEALLPHHQTVSIGTTATAATVGTLDSMTRRARLRIADVSFGAVAVYGILTYLSLGQRSLQTLAVIIALVFVLPALLAASLGVISRSRRWGAVTGAALGVAVVTAVIASFDTSLYGPTTRMTAWDLQAITIMCGSGALLGAAGAQARRIVSRRQTSNRNKQVVRSA